MPTKPDPKTGETELGAVRAIVFDTFGTVVDWRTSLIKSLELFGQKMELEAAWDRLVDRWRAAYKPNLDRVRRVRQRENAERERARDELHLHTHVCLRRLIRYLKTHATPDTLLNALRVIDYMGCERV